MKREASFARTMLRTFPLSLTLLACMIAAQAQTATFTYQGRLTDTSAAVNGTYDFQFTLYDAAMGGMRQPQPSPVTVTRTGVAVTKGVFMVQLDFTAAAFPGADRYLEISVKKSSDANYTTLTPRQQLTPSPYAIRTVGAGTADALSSSCLACVTDAQIAAVDGSKVSGTVASATNATNASQLDNVAASQYVQTSDSRLSDARAASSVNFGTATLSGTLPVARGGTGLSSPGTSGNFLKSNGSGWTSAPLSSTDIPAGSGNYIQNTTTQQAGSNFNISGNGTIGGTLTFGSTPATTGTTTLCLNDSNVVSTCSGGYGKYVLESTANAPLNAIITHNLNSVDIIPVVYKAIGGGQYTLLPFDNNPVARPTILNPNQIQIPFLAAGTYRVVIVR